MVSLTAEGEIAFRSLKRKRCQVPLSTAARHTQSATIGSIKNALATQQYDPGLEGLDTQADEFYGRLRREEE